MRLLLRLCGLAVVLMALVPGAASADPATDAVCLKVNTWLADHHFPERIDCSRLPDDPAARCVTLQEILAHDTPGVTYDCATGELSYDPAPSERDRICRSVNDWLAAHSYPERIDCAKLGDDPARYCARVDEELRASGIFVVFDCATGQAEPVRNQRPRAKDDSYRIAKNTTLTVAAPGVLANDRDDDGDTIFVTGVLSGPEHGTVTLRGDGSFGYDPATGFAGDDLFVYRITDGRGGTREAGVRIRIG